MCPENPVVRRRQEFRVVSRGAVVAGHPLDTTVRSALDELASLTHSHRIVGVYDAAKAAS